MEQRPTLRRVLAARHGDRERAPLGAPAVSGRNVLGDGWRRLSDPSAGKCHQRWEHESGWRVEHCGHPTALWPWSASSPEHRGDLVVSASGYAFPNLAAAASSVEDVVAGVAKLELGDWSEQYKTHVHYITGVSDERGSASAREAWAARR